MHRAHWICSDCITLQNQQEPLPHPLPCSESSQQHQVRGREMGNPSNPRFKLSAHSLLSEKQHCVAYCNQGDWKLREWPVPLIRSFSSSLLAHRIVLGLIKRLKPRRPLQGETILQQALMSQLTFADRKRWTAQKSAGILSALLQAPNFHPNCRNYQAVSRPRHRAKGGSSCQLGWGFGGGCIHRLCPRDPWAVPRRQRSLGKSQWMLHCRLCGPQQGAASSIRGTEH